MPLVTDYLLVAGYPIFSNQFSPARLPGEFGLVWRSPWAPVAGLPPGPSRLAAGMAYYSCSQPLRLFAILGGIAARPLQFIRMEFHPATLGTGCNDVIGIVSTDEGV